VICDGSRKESVGVTLGKHVLGMLVILSSTVTTAAT